MKPQKLSKDDEALFLTLGIILFATIIAQA